MKCDTHIIFIVLFVDIIYGDSDETRIQRSGFEEKFYWDYLDFEFPSGTKQHALASGSYIPRNNAIWAINVWRDRVFVSLFRFHVGVLSTLNYFSLNSKSKSPRLRPYPSFEDNYINEDKQDLTTSLPSDSSVISVAHFRIDKCDRLWVIDNGYTDFGGSPRVIAPQAIIIFDLTTDKLIRRIPITAKFVNPASVFLNVAVDIIGKNCKAAFAYIPDSLRSVIVYSFRKNRMWQLVHNYFGTDPHEGNLFYENLNFQWNLGVYGMAVGEECMDGSKQVYFTSLASTELFSISNRVLQNESYIALNKYFYDVHYIGDRGKHGQIIQLEYDCKTRVLLSTLIQKNSIGCWNTRTAYENPNLGVVYRKTHYFPGDVIIDRDRNLWMLSNRIPVNMYDLDNWTRRVKNMQIYVQSVDNAISGTICENINED